ncbi:DUF4255 domain-containing protein [Cellulomonas sp. URHD0024]|uniref:DUF4255 domain-containing protein n=1 Tax=Cellulomonas sp. URHD0024 TaxID=1302620 RepID=UPI0004225DF9|nr:DUF4255 domain-containing protein [Cellulomonas sp. URHD0024]
MLIPAVEDGLEKLLRSTLPLPVEQGDISFDSPNNTWSAQVNRLTVNLFLYGVSRSGQPHRGPAQRTNGSGALERRRALPMVELSYMVSAWAGSTRDEHLLLGDALARLLAHQVLPAQHTSSALQSSVQLSLADDEKVRPRDVWGGLGGTLKASFTLLVTVAADAYDWEAEAPQVTTVLGTAVPMPAGPRP